MFDASRSPEESPSSPSHANPNDTSFSVDSDLDHVFVDCSSRSDGVLNTSFRDSRNPDDDWFEDREDRKERGRGSERERSYDDDDRDEDRRDKKEESESSLGEVALKTGGTLVGAAATAAVVYGGIQAGLDPFNAGFAAVSAGLLWATLLSMAQRAEAAAIPLIPAAGACAYLAISAGLTWGGAAALAGAAIGTVATIYGAVKSVKAIGSLFGSDD